MAEENRRKVYETLSSKIEGIGTYEEFDRRMRDPENARAAWSFLADNYPGVGSFEEFKTRIEPAVGEFVKLDLPQREAPAGPPMRPLEPPMQPVAQPTDTRRLGERPIQGPATEPFPGRLRQATPETPLGGFYNPLGMPSAAQPPEDRAIGERPTQGPTGEPFPGRLRQATPETPLGDFYNVLDLPAASVPQTSPDQSRLPSPPDSAKTTAGVAEAPTTLPPDKEREFQQWYRQIAGQTGLDPNPDDPRHKYDYRGAFLAGEGPQISPEDGQPHWPSQFKAPDHPNRYVGGMDTRMGVPDTRTGAKVMGQALMPTLPETPMPHDDTYYLKEKIKRQKAEYLALAEESKILEKDPDLNFVRETINFMRSSADWQKVQQFSEALQTPPDTTNKEAVDVWNHNVREYQKLMAKPNVQDLAERAKKVTALQSNPAYNQKAMYAQTVWNDIQKIDKNAREEASLEVMRDQLIEWAEGGLKEVQKLKKERAGAPPKMMMGGRPFMWNDPSNDLDKAEQYLKDVISRKPSGDMEQFFAGLSDAATQERMPLIGGFVSAAMASKAVQLRGKTDLTPENKFFVDAYDALQTIKANPTAQNGWREIGSSLADFIPFAIEVMTLRPIMGPLVVPLRAGIGGVIGRTGMKQLAEKMVANQVGKIAVQTSKTLALKTLPELIAAGVASAALPHRTVDNFVQKALPWYEVGVSPEGRALERHLNKGKEIDDGIVSYFRSMGTTATEYATEFLGVVVQEPITLIKRVALGSLIDRHGINGAIKHMMEAGGIQGYIAEIFEELSATPIQTFINTVGTDKSPGFWEYFMSPDEFKKTATVIAIPQLLGLGASAAFSPARRQMDMDERIRGEQRWLAETISGETADRKKLVEADTITLEEWKKAQQSPDVAARVVATRVSEALRQSTAPVAESATEDRDKRRAAQILEEQRQQYWAERYKKQSPELQATGVVNVAEEPKDYTQILTELQTAGVPAQEIVNATEAQNRARWREIAGVREPSTSATPAHPAQTAPAPAVLDEKRWTYDGGSMPGEIAHYLDLNKEDGTARAGIVHSVDDDGGDAFYLAMPAKLGRAEIANHGEWVVNTKMRFDTQEEAAAYALTAMGEMSTMMGGKPIPEMVTAEEVGDQEHRPVEDHLTSYRALKDNNTLPPDITEEVVREIAPYMPARINPGSGEWSAWIAGWQTAKATDVPSADQTNLSKLPGGFINAAYAGFKAQRAVTQKQAAATEAPPPTVAAEQTTEQLPTIAWDKPTQDGSVRSVDQRFVVVAGKNKSGEVRYTLIDTKTGQKEPPSSIDVAKMKASAILDAEEKASRPDSRMSAEDTKKWIATASSTPQQSAEATPPAPPVKAQKEKSDYYRSMIHKQIDKTLPKEEAGVLKALLDAHAAAYATQGTPLWTPDYYEERITGVERITNGPEVGTVRPEPDGRLLIALRRDKATFETVLNEAGHVFLYDLVQAAKRNKQAAEDLRVIAGWLNLPDLAALTEGFIAKTLNAADVARYLAGHEKFAMATRTYVDKERAPVKELKEVFARIKEWLKSYYAALYKTIVQKEGALPNNVKMVYDRLLGGKGRVINKGGRPRKYHRAAEFGLKILSEIGQQPGGIDPDWGKTRDGKVVVAPQYTYMDSYLVNWDAQPRQDDPRWNTGAVIFGKTDELATELGFESQEEFIEALRAEVRAYERMVEHEAEEIERGEKLRAQHEDEIKALLRVEMGLTPEEATDFINQWVELTDEQINSVEAAQREAEAIARSIEVEERYEDARGVIEDIDAIVSVTPGSEVAPVTGGVRRIIMVEHKKEEATRRREKLQKKINAIREVRAQRRNELDMAEANPADKLVPADPKKRTYGQMVALLKAEIEEMDLQLQELTEEGGLFDPQVSGDQGPIFEAPDTKAQKEVDDALNGLDALFGKPVFDRHYDVKVDEIKYHHAKYLFEKVRIGMQTGIPSDAFKNQMVARFGVQVIPYVDRYIQEVSDEYDFRSGLAVFGATRKLGNLRRPSIQVVNAANSPRPGDYVPAGKYQIDEHQRHAVNLIVHRFKLPEAGFLLADGTGVGKTRTILVAAKEQVDRTGMPAIIIVPNKTLINTRYAEDAKALGIDLEKSRIRLATYKEVSEGDKSKEILNSAWGLVVYDEAHNLKNPASLRSWKAGLTLKARNKVYATATPMDNAQNAAYFLASISGRTEEDVAKLLGYEIIWELDPHTKEPRPRARLLKGFTWEKVFKNIIKLRNEAIEQGAMVRREYPFFGVVEIHPEEVVVDHEEEEKIIEYWDARIARAKSMHAKMMLAGQKIQELSRWTEPQKVQMALRLAKEAMAQGRRVIIAAKGVNTAKLKGTQGAAMADIYNYEGEEIRAAINLLTEALEAEGIKYAKIYGQRDKALEVMKFQKGEVKVAVMTPESGGAGIDLDDQTGDAPRTMICLTFPWSADIADQMMGRPSRRNTKSPVHVMFIASTSAADARIKAIQRRKMGVLKRIQSGEDPDAAMLQDDIDQKMKAAIEEEKKKGQTTRVVDADVLEDDLEELASWDASVDPMPSPVHGLSRQSLSSIPPSVVPDGTPMVITDEVRKVYDKLGIPVAERRLSRKYLGMFFPRTKGVRVQSLFDVFTATHEAVHALSERYGIGKELYTPVRTGAGGKKILDPAFNNVRNQLRDVYEKYYPGAKNIAPLRTRVEEGMAMLFEMYFYDPARMQAEYPDLVMEFIQPSGRFYHESWTKLLDGMGEIVGNYARLSPEDQIAARVVRGDERLRKDLGFDLRQYWEYNLFNMAEPLRRYGNRFTKGITSENPFVMWLGFWVNKPTILNSWIAGKSEMTLTLEKRGNKYTLREDKGNVRTLQRMVEGKGKLFDSVLVSRRVVGDHNKLTRLKNEKAVAMQWLAAATMQGNEDLVVQMEMLIQMLTSQIANLQSIIDKDDLPLQAATLTLRNHETEFAEALALFDAINDRMLTFAVTTGWISQAKADAYRENKDYASFLRMITDDMLAVNPNAMPATNSTAKPKAFLNRTGSTLPIISPMLNQITAIGEIVGKGMNNMIWRTVYDLAQKNPSMLLRFRTERTIIRRDPQTGKIEYPQEKDPNLIRIMIGGQRVFIQAAPEFMEMVENMKAVDLGAMAKLLTLPSMWFTRMTTSANPLFSVGNYTVDQISGAMNTETGMIPILSPSHLLWSYLTNNKGTLDEFERYKAMGGERQTFASMYREDMTPEEILARAGGHHERKITDVVDSALGFLELPSNMSEYMTRFAEFRRAKEQGHDDIEAMYMANEVTTPFQLRGYYWGRGGQLYVRAIPYLNASMQVAYKYLRTAKAHPWTVATVTAGLMTASLACSIAIMRWGSQKQKRILGSLEVRELVRAIYVPMPGSEDKLLRFRVPEQIGMWNALVMMWVMKMYDGREIEFNDYLDATTAGLPQPMQIVDFPKWREYLASMTPQVVKPITEIAYNTKTYPDFGPLVPPAMLQNEIEEQQYTVYTSTVAKEIGGWLKMSPIQIEHFMRGYGGGAIGLGLNAADVLATGDTNKLTRRLPFLQYEREYALSGRVYNEFYSRADAADKSYKRMEIYKNLSTNEAAGIIRNQVLHQEMLGILSNYRRVVKAWQGPVPEEMKEAAYQCLLAFHDDLPPNELAARMRTFNKMLKDETKKAGIKLERWYKVSPGEVTTDIRKEERKYSKALEK